MNKKSARYLFGKRVRELRLKNGWTQSELARRAKISISYLQKIEGKNPPNVTVETIEKFSKAYHISLKQLMRF